MPQAKPVYKLRLKPIPRKHPANELNHAEVIGTGEGRVRVKLFQRNRVGEIYKLEDGPHFKTSDIELARKLLRNERIERVPQDDPLLEAPDAPDEPVAEEALAEPLPDRAPLDEVTPLDERRAELDAMTIKQLRALAEQVGVTQRGKKAEVLERIVALEFGL